MKLKSDLIFGIRTVSEAIRSGKEIDKVLILKKTGSQLHNELFSLIRQHSLPFQYVPVEKLNRLTKKNHQGVVAYISPVPYYPLDEIVMRCFDSGKEPFILILDQITDIGNFGAIARSAECMGVDVIVIPEKGSASINADAVKISAGALLRVPVSKVSSLKKSVEYLRNSGIKIFAGTEKAEVDAGEAILTGPVAIIVGSEDRGISPALLRMSDELIKIPMSGNIQSLNVSVATAILLYEVMKQRNSA